MRIIDVEANEVRAVAVSANGRWIAASGAGGWYAVYEWANGETVHRLPLGTACNQFAFGQFAFGLGNWVAYVHHSTLRIDRLDAIPIPPQPAGEFAGGIAISPDGKKFVATKAGLAGLACWELPSMRQQTGFDVGSPFRRLAFSPDGQFLAGIWPGVRDRRRAESATFELRFAVSGGRDYHYPPMKGGAFDSIGFVSFARDSRTCAFGWEGEFHVLDISTGTSRYLRRVEAEFRDAAFTGSGHLFATVDGAGLLKLWDAGAWQVIRAYDWGCGALTCLAFTADGTAGVCGTADGRLVQFDVDE